MRLRNVLILCGIVICVTGAADGPVSRAHAELQLRAVSPQAAATGAAAAEMPPPELLKLSEDFWYWRSVKQPYTADDIPRLDRPAVPPDWSTAEIRVQRRQLALFDQQYHAIDASHWPIAAQIDYRLLGSALARVHWELDVNPRWQRDPTFYVDQTLGALTQALIDPPLMRDGVRVFGRVQFTLQGVPATLASAKENLHPLRPLAELAIAVSGALTHLARASANGAG